MARLLNFDVLFTTTRQQSADRTNTDLRISVLIFVYILMTASIATAGYRVYRKQTEAFLAEQISELIGIEHRLTERRRDIQPIQSHPDLISAGSIKRRQRELPPESKPEDYPDTSIETPGVG